MPNGNGDTAFDIYNNPTESAVNRAGVGMSDKDALKELAERRTMAITPSPSASLTPQLTSGDDADKAALAELQQRRTPQSQGRVAEAFGQLPTSPVAMAPMEPGLREVGPSSEDLVKYAGALYGGTFGVTGATRILSSLIKATPKVAGAALTGAVFEAGRRGLGAILGEEPTSRLMDIVHKYGHYMSETP